MAWYPITWKLLQANEACERSVLQAAPAYKCTSWHTLASQQEQGVGMLQGLATCPGPNRSEHPAAIAAFGHHHGRPNGSQRRALQPHLHAVHGSVITMLHHTSPEASGQRTSALAQLKRTDQISASGPPERARWWIYVSSFPSEMWCGISLRIMD